MRTFSVIKGLPVFNKMNGEKIGEVYDISLSDKGKVNGLILKKGTFLKKDYFIPIGDVSSFGPDGIMVDDSSLLKKMDEHLEGYTFEGQKKLAGMPLLSAEGKKLGLLEDVYFHEELGTIVGYECTDGFFSDMAEGRRVIQTDLPPKIGKDAIIVDIKQ